LKLCSGWRTPVSYPRSLEWCTTLDEGKPL